MDPTALLGRPSAATRAVNVQATLWLEAKLEVDQPCCSDRGPEGNSLMCIRRSRGNPRNHMLLFSPPSSACVVQLTLRPACSLAGQAPCLTRATKLTPPDDCPPVGLVHPQIQGFDDIRVPLLHVECFARQPACSVCSKQLVQLNFPADVSDTYGDPGSPTESGSFQQPQDGSWCSCTCPSSCVDLLVPPLAATPWQQGTPSA